MKRVSLLLLFGAGWLSGCAARWDPAKAAAVADRDIKARKIQFCYVGGRVPRAPGLPDVDISRYPKIAVGPQGCVQNATYEMREEYARRYNERMWQHFFPH